MLNKFYFATPSGMLQYVTYESYCNPFTQKEEFVSMSTTPSYIISPNNGYTGCIDTLNLVNLGKFI